MVNQSLEKPHIICRTKEWDAAEDWIGRIKHIENELDTITDRTEENFLPLSVAFTDFHSRARTIFKLSSAIAAQMTGAEIAMAIDGLNGLLEKMETYINRSETSMSMSIEKLREIQDTIHNIHDPLKCFQSITKTLRHLSVTASIQSAPLLRENKELKVLLDDVKQFSEIISSRADSIQNGLTSQRSLFEQTLSEIFLFEEKQQSRAKMVLEETISILLSITEQYGISTVAAKRISARSSEISSSTEEIVTAVQFHDITSQHLEGVKKALGYAHKSCLALFDGRGAVPDDKKMEIVVARLMEFCKQQSVQLEHIRETFVTAVEGIANNLRHIGVNVADISGDIQKITGDNGRNRKTFISEMEGMLSSVNASFNIIIKNADASRKLLDRMLLLSSNVKEEVAKFITDIEEIAFNIKLIAFNTEIKSSQIGKEGFALEVVADRIQQLSRETSEKAETVSEMLRIITASADELSSGITAAVQGSPDEVVKISGELEILEKTFSALNKNIVPLLSDIDMNARDLSGDIQRLTESINVHIVFDERVKRAVSELTAISLHSQQSLLKGVKPERESYRHPNRSFPQGPFEISEVEFLSGIHSVPESALIAEYDIRKKSVNNIGNSIEFF